MLWVFKQKSTENIFFESAKTTANSTDYFTVTKSSEPVKMMQVTARTQARAEIRDCQLQQGHWQGSTSERAEKTATAGLPATLKTQETTTHVV